MKHNFNKTDRHSTQNFDFVFTKDGSVGLYNYDVEDIYHSVYGAKTEGWEKFVKPLEFEKNFSYKKSLKILDICFGIGYNTKAFLKKLVQTGYKGEVQIDLLEYDKKLVLLSPFIKDGFFKMYPEISLLLLEKLLPDILSEKEMLNEILLNPENKKFIEPFYLRFIKKNIFNRYSCDPLCLNKRFVHNIYYHCISPRIKKRLNSLKNGEFIITPYFNDARKTVLNKNDKYDIIFLDAFTPSKLPTLWSLDFFKELRRLTHDKTILLTYSNSSAVRHAMIDAGFCVGKIYDFQNRNCGTIASTNKNFIKNHLNEYDFGLMNTNAGVYFRDEGLCNNVESIINEYNTRKTSLNLESSSHFIKNYKTENGVPNAKI